MRIGHDHASSRNGSASAGDEEKKAHIPAAGDLQATQRNDNEEMWKCHVAFDPQSQSIGQKQEIQDVLGMSISRARGRPAMKRVCTGQSAAWVAGLGPVSAMRKRKGGGGDVEF